jgi:hypothetical protein
MDQLSNNNKKNSTHKFFMVLSAVLFGISIFLGYQLYKSKSTIVVQTKAIEVVSGEYDLAKKELEVIQGKYDELSTDNKQLQSQLDLEREKISDISEQLEKYKSNAAVVSKLRKELESIRKLIKSYLHQIDSLNVTNQKLTEENLKVRGDLENQKNVTTLLTKEKEVLNAKVEIGAKLKAYDLFADGVNEKGSKNVSTNKARRCDKIRASFTLPENSLSKPGEKIIYMRITGPDGNTYNNGTDASSTFSYKGEKLVFSAKKTILYENKNREVEMHFTKRDKFLEGKYKVELYCDDALIGETTTELN